MDNTSYIPPDKPLGDEATQGTSPLGDVISKLMSNPELMEMISSALGKEKPASASPISDPVSKQEPPPADEPPPVTGTEDISSKLPEMMAVLAPMLGGTGAGSLGEVIKKAERRDDKRACLLRAIKPYVSRGRGEAIDYMIRIAGVTEILKHLS